LGLLVGAAIGYVLGARAGRPRYEQLKRWGATFRQHPALAQLSEQAQGVFDLGRSIAAKGLETGSEGLRKLS
jgi:hypothetical protein